MCDERYIRIRLAWILLPIKNHCRPLLNIDLPTLTERVRKLIEDLVLPLLFFDGQ